MNREITATVSFTEAPQFRRLVRFAEDVEVLARINGDDELAELVEELRRDLGDLA